MEHADAAATSPDANLLAAQVEKIRASGVLGKSAQLNRLFEFLFACHLQQRTPKEFEIAVDGLGRSESFDVTQDAMVRVYIHKLRRKLDEYYADAGRDEPQRLVLPRGEYRLTLEGTQTGTASAGTPLRSAAHPPRPGWFRPALRDTRGLTSMLLALSLVLNLVGGTSWLLQSRFSPAHQLQSSTLWQPLLDDARPITIVVGDYYVFAETDGTDVVKRLVRDFDINSRNDLTDRTGTDARLACRQFDVGLSYLPTATAYAVNRLSPILTTANKQARVILASELTPETLRNDHIVFIGHLSALGLLNDIVLDTSGFRLGRSYDELQDKKSGQRFISSSGIPGEATGGFNHLAYLASLSGPTGNRIVVLAGLRDAGLKELANVISSTNGITEINARTTGIAFEALYQSSGFGPATTPARLMLARPLQTTISHAR